MDKAKILGNLVAAQSILASLPTEERVIEFLCQAIHYVPGVAEINAFWGSEQIVRSPKLSAYCEKCGKIPKNYSYHSCPLQPLNNLTRVPLQIQNKTAGVINILADSSGNFMYFKPHVLNIVNASLTTLENKRLLKDLAAENERNFSALASSIPETIYRFKHENDWTITFISDNIIQLSGFPAADFINGTINKLIDIVHPDDRSNVRSIIANALKTKSPFMLDYRIIHADGSIRWVHERGQGVNDNEGELKFLQGTIFDITERKNHEAHLIAARNAAETANRAKTEFLTNMSHDLRTPLNGILGYAQILQRMENASAEQQKYAAIIRQSGEYLLTLIDDLLDLSRIEADMLKLNKQNFSISRLLQEISNLFSLRAKEKHIDFQFETLGILPKGVYGDQKCLKQILINLLTNAVKFTDRGKVWLHVDYCDDFLMVSVGDTGCGIEEQDFEKIFEPFQQLKHPAKYSEGTGLGLTISKKLAEIMDGQIELDSSAGKGSTFKIRVYLPAAPMAKDRQNQQQITLAKPLQPLKILIVDDNADNLMMLDQLLTSVGFNVCVVQSGRQCLDIVAQNKPDVILMDLIMPEMNGFETTRRLRAIETTKKPVIIALSANALAKDKEQSLAAGCDDFISKPVHLDELLLCLRKHTMINNSHSADDGTQTTAQIEVNRGLRRTSILVADDNEINRLLLNAQLSKTGATITEAKDGIEALALIQQTPFNLILMDLHMPGLNGAEIMQHLKNNPATINQHTPVIAITAYASEQQLSALPDAGFTDYLIKPILENKLHSILKRYCSV